MQTSTQIAADFDRIAEFDHAEGWSHNSHYHTYLLKHIPAHCEAALDVGCGTGGFTRQIAAQSAQVLGIDLSPRMIELARERSTNLPNVDYRVQDVMSFDAPPASYDCIVSIATLHHLPFAGVLPRLRDWLRQGGRLLILDLFNGRDLTGVALAIPALIASAVQRQQHPQFASNPDAVAAWNAHGVTDVYQPLSEIRRIAADVLPGARIKRHLLFRYSLIWTKP